MPEIPGIRHGCVEENPPYILTSGLYESLRITFAVMLQSPLDKPACEVDRLLLHHRDISDSVKAVEVQAQLVNLSFIDVTVVNTSWISSYLEFDQLLRPIVERCQDRIYNNTHCLFWQFRKVV